jgi:PKD repeat protein
VSLIAANPYGRDAYVHTSYLTVYGHPVASFSGTPLTGTASLFVDFFNYSLNATSYRWDFGDGSISYTKSPSHLYLDTGVYTVTLTASNPYESDTLVRPVYITLYNAPSAGFSAEPTQGSLSLTATFHQYLAVCPMPTSGPMVMA